MLALLTNCICDQGMRHDWVDDGEIRPNAIGVMDDMIDVTGFPIRRTSPRLISFRYATEIQNADG